MKAVDLILDLTSDCNLRCKYCYASGGEHQHKLKVEEAVLAIEKLYFRYKCIVQVLFHGGEPLLCYEELCEIVHIIKGKEWHEFVKWTIQTNGTLLSERILSFLIDNKIGIGISIDGIRDESNNARPLKDGEPSTAQTLEAIKLIKLKNIPINILSVITSVNNCTYEKDMKMFLELGVRVFSLNPYISAGRGAIAKLGVSDVEMLDLYIKVINTIIEQYEKKDTVIFERNIYYMLKRLLTGKDSYMCMANPCGAGLAQFAISAEGEMYPCADFCGNSLFSFGHVTDDFFSNALRNAQWREIRSYALKSFQQCQQCSLIDACPGGCAVRCFYTNESISSIDPLCSFYKLFIPYLNEPKLIAKLTRIWKIT